MNKIQALKKTVYDLKNGLTEYGWYSSNHCNCGVVAKTLLEGKLPLENGALDSPEHGPGGPFSRRAYCITTNLPLPKVYQVLKDAGFTYNELRELEYLGNEKIAGMLGLKTYYNNEMKCNISLSQKYTKKETLISYLETWISLLEKENQSTKYTDITKELAVLPVEEVSDVTMKQVLV